MKLEKPRRRSVHAHALADRRYHKKIVRDKTKYTRKGRHSSTRKFEDSFQLANCRELIEPTARGARKGLCMSTLKIGFLAIAASVAFFFLDAVYVQFEQVIVDAPFYYRALMTLQLLAIGGMATCFGLAATLRLAVMLWHDLTNHKSLPRG